MGSNPEDDRGSHVPSTQDNNTKGKGKDVAKDHETQHEVEIPRQADGNSVMSRLGRSAAGLSKSILQGAPSGQDLAKAVVPAKAGGSSSSSRHQDNSVAQASSSPRFPSEASGGAEFRSIQTDEHVAAEEAAFSEFLDSTSVSLSTEPAGFERAWQAANFANSTSTGYGTSGGRVSSSVAEQQERDGVEVVHLLSQADGEPLYEGSVTLSRTELETLRRALFEGDSAAQISATDWNNVLNFIPGFLRGQDVDGMHGPEDTHMNLGVTDTAEAGQIWLEEWNRVLTSYTDEVWGDLGDMVQQAQREVQQLKERGSSGQKQDSAALRRLQTVLTRVRARL